MASTSQKAAQFVLKPSFVLVAIDTGPSMFITRENSEGSQTHCFKDCIEACYELAESLICATSRNAYNKFAIVLDQPDVKNQFIEFDANFIDTVKLLRERSNFTNEQLKKLYERPGSPNLETFLLACNSKLQKINCDFYKKTIIYITNDDDPLKNDPQAKYTVFNKIKDFKNSRINLEVVTMREDFDYSIFYSELFSIYGDSNLYEETCEDKMGILEKLSLAIVQDYSKRKINFYPFRNDYKRYIKCLKVNFIQPSKLYNNTKISEDKKILKRKPASKNVPKTFSIKSNNFSEFELDAEERIKCYKNDLPIGLHLLYISKRNTDIGFILNSPSLLKVDPKEDLPFYNQFWQYCVDNDVVLVCLAKHMILNKIRFVELIPKYANNTKFFLTKNIPFVTEIKYPKSPVASTDVCDDERKLECAALLIQELDFDYNPRMLPNLSYRKKRAYLKAKLLDEQAEDVIDRTASQEEVDQNIEEIVEEIKTRFNTEEVTKGNKRKLANRN